MCNLKITGKDSYSENNYQIIQDTIHAAYNEIRSIFQIQNLDLHFYLGDHPSIEIQRNIMDYSLFPVSLGFFNKLSGKVIPFGTSKNRKGPHSYFIFISPIQYMELNFNKNRSLVYHSLHNLVFHELIHVVIIEREIAIFSLNQYKRIMKYIDISVLSEKYNIEEFYVNYILLYKLVLDNETDLLHPFNFVSSRGDLMRVIHPLKKSFEKYIENNYSYHEIEYIFFSYLGQIFCLYYLSKRYSSKNGSIPISFKSIFTYIGIESNIISLESLFTNISTLVNQLLIDLDVERINMQELKRELIQSTNKLQISNILEINFDLHQIIPHYLECISKKYIKKVSNLTILNIQFKKFSSNIFKGTKSGG